MPKNWWDAVSFSVGGCMPSYAEWPHIRQFPSVIKNKEELTNPVEAGKEITWEDLKEKLTDLCDNSKQYDKLDEDEEEAVSKFLAHWEHLHDDRTRIRTIRDAVENRCRFASGFGGGEAELMHFYPEEYKKKLPKNGGWIIVLLDIPVAPANKPDKFGVYFAKEKSKPTEFTIEYIGSVKFQYYMVEITTEAGPVSLNPHEYALVHDMDDVLSAVGTEREMIKLGGNTNYDNAKVHYLATRGIPQADVYNMLLGSVNSTKFAYFKLKPEYFEVYEFYIDCFSKGIRQEMADRLWECKQTGKPLFKINYMIEGKEVTEDEFNANRAKNRKEADSTEYQAEN